jgi:AcrR family transcriptional regulator
MRMTELAAAAKVPIGSVYQYFPEKAAIVKALFDRHSIGDPDRVAEAFASVQSVEQALDVLEATVDWHYQDYRSDAASLGIWLGTETDQDLAQLNVEHNTRIAGSSATRCAHRAGARCHRHGSAHLSLQPPDRLIGPARRGQRSLLGRSHSR